MSLTPEQRQELAERFATKVRPGIKLEADRLIGEVFKEQEFGILFPEVLDFVNLLGYQEEEDGCKLGKVILDESPYDGTWGNVQPYMARSGGIHASRKQGPPGPIDTTNFVDGTANLDALPGWGHTFQAPHEDAPPLTAQITPTTPPPPEQRPITDPTSGRPNYWSNTWDIAPRPDGCYNVIKSLEFFYRPVGTGAFTGKKKRAHIVVLFCGESGGP